MFKDRLLRRLLLVSVLVIVTLTASACYKNAGENVQPTSNTVDLADLQPTTPPPPTLFPTNTMAPTFEISPTFTLKPTITPADIQPTQPVASPTVAATATEQVPSTAAPTEAQAIVPPTFTPIATLSTPDGLLLTTPGMSDIVPTSTPVPTLDPANRPSPTPIPPEENPCLHIVQPNDTLYSIARDNEVSLADLIAANPVELANGEYTILQLGMLLRIPGCDLGLVITPESGTIGLETPASGLTPVPTSAGGVPTQHVVQGGETVYSIGRLYNVDPNQIIALNNLANPNLIQPGDVLLLPTP